MKPSKHETKSCTQYVLSDKKLHKIKTHFALYFCIK